MAGWGLSRRSARCQGACWSVPSPSRPRDLLGASPSRTWSPGCITGPAWPAGAKRSGSRSRPATTGSPPGEVASLGVRRRRSRRPGPGARLGPGRVRYLHLRCLVDGSVLIVPRTVLGRDGRGRPGSPQLPNGARILRSGRRREIPGWPADGPELARRQPARATLGAGGGRGGRRDQVGPCARWCSPANVFATADEPIDARVLLRRLALAIRTASRSPATGWNRRHSRTAVRRPEPPQRAGVGGTLPRGTDPAQDKALGEELLASAKDNEEHAYAVDVDIRRRSGRVPGARRPRRDRPC